MFQRLTMAFLYHRAVVDRLKPEHYRQQFQILPMPRTRQTQGHSHPASAADRNVAGVFADQLAARVGSVPYYVQRSRSDEYKGRLGSRVPFWSKDLNTEPTHPSAPSNALFVYVDVDYYYDMPSVLCDNFAPTLLYTFQPSQVARNAPEYCFTFNEHNEVDYRVTGGGHYRHHVWNYSVDSLLVVKTCFWLPYKFAAYSVDRRAVAVDHELVMLTPLRKWRGLYAILAWLCLEGPSLVTLTPVEGRFLRLAVHEAGQGLKMSTGQVGNYATATIVADNDDALRLISTNSKYDLTLAQATAQTDGDKVPGAVLLDYHKTKSGAKSPVVCPVQDSVRTYAFDPSNYLQDDVKPLLKPFMSPLLNDCFVPMSGVVSEGVAVQERVNKVKTPELPMTSFLHACMNEFLTFLIPVPHQLDPYDNDYLLEHQNRPSQRRILETSLGADPNRVCQSFLKKEPYGQVKAPRLISTINGVDKAAYSLFIYPFTAEILKPQDWYAFGKTPLEIAHRVTAICTNALFDVCKTDFNKFDGRSSNLQRELEQRALLRGFRLQYHAELLDLHGAHQGLRAFTTNGVAYDTDYIRLSGGADTAAFNGVTNAFVAYLERRMTKPRGEPGDTPEQAWTRLGIYGGDDGLSADVEPRTYEQAAAMIGHKLTIEPVKRESHGVMFLARVYGPDVWHGDPTSVCDLPRQLSKFHTTVALGQNVTPVMKFLEKCRAYWLTDENTPFIGPLTQKARALLQCEFTANPETAPMTPWSAQFPKDVQYPNEPREWYMEYAQLVLPNADHRAFVTWLAQANSFKDLMSPPLLQEKTPPVTFAPVVIDDDVVLPVETHFIPSSAVKAKTVTQARLAKADDKIITKEIKEKKDFETWKQERIRAGTWVDKGKDPVEKPKTKAKPKTMDRKMASTLPVPPPGAEAVTPKSVPEKNIPILSGNPTAIPPVAEPTLPIIDLKPTKPVLEGAAGGGT